MRKANINHTLNNLRLPKYLQRYLMFVEDNLDENNQIFQLNFWTTRIPKSKEFSTPPNGPILTIPNNYKIDCNTNF